MISFSLYRLSKKYSILALALFSAAWASAEPLENYLPDNTIAFIKVESLKAMREGLESSAAAEIWEKEQFDEFFAPSLERLELWRDSLEEEWDVDRMMELLVGQVALGLQLEREGEEVKEGFALIADFSGDADALAELIHPISDVHNPQEGFVADGYEETFMGETLYVEETERPDGTVRINGWALVDGIAVLGDPLPMLKDTVARIKEPGARTLAENALFRRAVDTEEAHVCYGYLNLTESLALLKEDFLGGAENAFSENPQLMMLGITPEGIVDALGIELLEAFSFSMGQYNGLPGVRTGIFFKRREGFVKLLAYQEGKPALPSFVPEEVIAASISHYSLGEMWNNLEGMLGAVSPNLASMLQLQMDRLRERTGLDIRESFINNLGNTIANVTFPVSQQAQQGEESSETQVVFSETLTAIPLRDPVALRLYVKTLVEQVLPGMTLFQENPYMGEVIYTLDPKLTGGATGGFAYAITDEYLLIGIPGVEPIKTVLSRMASGEGDTLWDTPWMQEAFRVLPPDAQEYSYLDLERYLGQLIATLRDNPVLSEPLQEFVDFSALPEDLSVPYHSTGSLQVDDRAIRTLTLLFEKYDAR